MKDKYARITRKASLSFLGLIIGTNLSMAQNNPPVANNDTVIYSGSSIQISMSSLLANDIDPDGNSLSWDTVINLTGNGTTNWYTQNAPMFFQQYSQDHPDSVFFGVDTLKYVVCDDGTPSLCDTAYIFIIVDYEMYPYYTFLDINNINARFNVSGSDFWDPLTGSPIGIYIIC